MHYALTLKIKKSSINMAPKGRIPAIRILKGKINTNHIKHALMNLNC